MSDSNDLKKEIVGLIKKWGSQSGKTLDEYNEEIDLIERFFTLPFSPSQYSFICIYNGKNELISYSIEEILNDSWALAHFGQANKDYKGIFQYTEWLHCSVLSKSGIKFLNYEQDLGLVGLKVTKKHYAPVGYLKKYALRKKV